METRVGRQDYWEADGKWIELVQKAGDLAMQQLMHVGRLLGFESRMPQKKRYQGYFGLGLTSTAAEN